jgi:hypothetical protein
MEEDGEKDVYVVEARRRLPVTDWLDGVEPSGERQRKFQRRDDGESFGYKL